VLLAAGEIAETLIGLSEDQRRGIIDLRAAEIVAGLSDRDQALPVVRDLQDLIAPLIRERTAVRDRDAPGNT
jgi:hypothetical protein